MSLAVRMRNKRKPEGWELVEGPLLQFEERLREDGGHLRQPWHKHILQQQLQHQHQHVENSQYL